MNTTETLLLLPPAKGVCGTFPLQCLYNSSNSLQKCSLRKRCMCEVFWHLYCRSLPVWRVHLKWTNISQPCTHLKFQNLPRKKKKMVEEHHHSICSLRLSNPTFLLLKKGMFPRPLATRPIFPTLHCSPKRDKCPWRFATSHLIQETSGSWEGEDAQKQDSVWWLS